MSTIEGFHCIQDTSPGPQGVHGSTVHRTLHQVPKVSTIEGFHCIQDTSPGPQGVHGSTVHRTLHQVPRVFTIEWFHCTQHGRSKRFGRSGFGRTSFRDRKFSELRMRRIDRENHKPHPLWKLLRQRDYAFSMSVDGCLCLKRTSKAQHVDTESRALLLFIALDLPRYRRAVTSLLKQRLLKPWSCSKTTSVIDLIVHAPAVQGQNPS